MCAKPLKTVGRRVRERTGKGGNPGYIILGWRIASALAISIRCCLLFSLFFEFPSTITIEDI